MKNIAEWIVEERNKNNPYALDTFTDFTAKAVKRYNTFNKRCDMFSEVYNIEINEAQRERLHKWLCSYVASTNYQDMINQLITMM